MSKAIDDLMREHDAILSSLKILDRIATDIGGGTMPDQLDLSRFTGFLKEFTDKCHHGKEEGILFPALINAGIPKEGGPIAVMLSEHEQGRSFIREMDRATASGPDYEAFAGAARQYSALIKGHIQKENGVLFPIAERALDKDRLEQLFEAFEEHEENVIGHGRHEKLHELLEGMKAKYLG